MQSFYLIKAKTSRTLHIIVRWVLRKIGKHPKYIGQAERGEKNLTLVSLEKILSALGGSFSEFFAYMEPAKNEPTTAARCYELINSKNKSEQEKMYRILLEIEQLMD